MKRVLYHIGAALLASALLLSLASCHTANDPADTACTTEGAVFDVTEDAIDGTAEGTTEDATNGATEGVTEDVTEDATEGTTEGTTEDATEGTTQETADTTPSTQPSHEETTEPVVQEPLENLAPDFTVLDWDGNAVKLSDLVGKPIVLNFWASWCPPCKAEMPDFEEAYKKYGDKVIFMMVNLTDGYSETIDTAKAHIVSSGYTFPVYFDVAFQGAYAYQVESIPQTCFINARGQLVSTSVGMIDGATLEARIGVLLGD